ncbi:hypothetical protein TUN199_06393 [Pyrenophora tritici-repentis]|nr:adh-short domain-containing protein [Pyrenophora tritici-repentis]KAI0609558.1 adh-short domain-containing protein [Pyrenophora tritici-repentis]KAI0621630.1 hypothetical protein TUN199_06393 [Pyrenophora tritici-repentis]
MDTVNDVDILPDEHWDHVFATNLTAPVSLMRNGCTYMIKAGGRSLIGATKQVAFQYRADRIHYNTFSPSVSTNILSSIDQTKFELEGLALVKLIHKLSKLDKTESG